GHGSYAHWEARMVRALSVNPSIFYIENFVTHEEALAMMQFALPRLTPSSVVYADTGTNGYSSSRTSKQAIIQRGLSPAVDAVSERLHVLFGVPPEAGLAEAAQILHYDVGETFSCHHDPYETLAHRPYVRNGSPYNR